MYFPGLVLVTKVPTKDADPWLFTMPFTPAMWLAIFVVGLWSGLVFWVLESAISNESDDIQGRDGRTLGGFMRNFFTTQHLSMSSVYGTTCHTPKTAAGRLYSLAWIFFCVMVVTAYTANLATILVTRKISLTTTSMETLIDSNKNPVLCNKLGTAFGKYVNSTYHGKLLAVGGRMLWSKNLQGMKENLMAGRCDALVEVAELARKLVTSGVDDEQEKKDAAANRQLKGAGGGAASGETGGGAEACQLTQAGNMFWKQNMGVGVNKRLQVSGIADKLSEHILQLKHEGTLDKLKQDWFMGLKCPVKVGSVSAATSMQLEIANFSTPVSITLIVGLMVLALRLMRVCLPKDTKTKIGNTTKKVNCYSGQLSVTNLKDTVKTGSNFFPQMKPQSRSQSPVRARAHTGETKSI